MKKLTQGKYQLFTTKADAIEKFMQIQGISREKMSGGNRIEFNCYKNGKIVITNPRNRSVGGDNATNLYAEIIEQNGKTYITYYTVFIKTIAALKYVCLAIDIIMAIVGILLAVVTKEKISSLLLLAFSFAFFFYQMLALPSDKNYSHQDSEILVKELKKRVDAVNEWDK